MKAKIKFPHACEVYIDPSQYGQDMWIFDFRQPLVDFLAPEIPRIKSWVTLRMIIICKQP